MTNRTGAERIADERRRQIEERGYGLIRDMEYTCNELAEAAESYLWAGIYATRDEDPHTAGVGWPWGGGWKPSEDPVRNLEKAGALIAAEIDRLLAEDPTRD